MPERASKTRLVVVESPTKARTIRGFLPGGYRVAADGPRARPARSAREIPAKYKGQEWARFGVNVANDFQPLYVIPGGKREIVSELQGEL